MPGNEFTYSMQKSDLLLTNLTVKSGADVTNLHSPHFSGLEFIEITYKSRAEFTTSTSKSAALLTIITSPYKGIPLQVQLSLSKVGFRKEFSTSSRLSGSAA